eukprot:6190243-Pleurochrysis_carterae.AAC.1
MALCSLDAWLQGLASSLLMVRAVLARRERSLSPASEVRLDNSHLMTRPPPPDPPWCHFCTANITEAFRADFPASQPCDSSCTLAYTE